jgi:chemotaxis response regulator CheB
MSTQAPTRTRDVVVIGCSAGGIDALTRILQDLNAGTTATVLIAQHLARTENPYLVSLLQRATKLPVMWAEQGGKLERGKVIVAPPDLHLLVSERHLQLSRGPRENHARPSIDKLFRTAAAELENRVIGVLLTGMLSDGVAGLLAIRDAGGATIVQDPAQAAFPDLPTNALLAMRPDHVLPIDSIGAVLDSLIGRCPCARKRGSIVKSTRMRRASRSSDPRYRSRARTATARCGKSAAPATGGSGATSDTAAPRQTSCDPTRTRSRRRCGMRFAP